MLSGYLSKLENQLSEEGDVQVYLIGFLSFGLYNSFAELMKSDCSHVKTKQIMNKIILSAIFLGTLFISNEVKAELAAPLKEHIKQKTLNFSATERNMLQQWSDGKLISEFFCQNHALQVLSKTYQGADRVFLSLSDDDPPTLLTETRIKGNGSVRYEDGWVDFIYECEIDKNSGKVTDFTFLESKNP